MLLVSFNLFLSFHVDNPKKHVWNQAYWKLCQVRQLVKFLRNYYRSLYEEFTDCEKFAFTELIHVFGSVSSFRGSLFLFIAFILRYEDSFVYIIFVS